MTSITIQNLDDETMQKLSQIAEANGHSVEEEVRYMLVRSVHQATQRGLGTLIMKEFEPVDGVELELPASSIPARA